jgi:hypothetical protein
MSTVKGLSRSFSSGEITPELFGRIDLAKRQEGLARCRNFITLPHGPAINRPGTEFVREVKTSASATRLIPFSYNNAADVHHRDGGGLLSLAHEAATLTYTDGSRTYLRPPSRPQRPPTLSTGPRTACPSTRP